MYLKLQEKIINFIIYIYIRVRNEGGEKDWKLKHGLVWLRG